MEMNNDIFTPNLPIPEPVSFEDAPIPIPVEEEKPAETPPPRRRHKADALANMKVESKPKELVRPKGQAERLSNSGSVPYYGTLSLSKLKLC